MNEHDDKTNPGKRPSAGIGDMIASHPVGVVAGALAGAAAGAVGGIAAGPLGSLAGLVGGAALGGLMGGGGMGSSAAGEQLDADDLWWRGHHAQLTDATAFESYLPAYRFGTAARRTGTTGRWEEVEPELAQRWARLAAQDRKLDWRAAAPAVRAAWDGSASRDGEDPGL